MTKGYQCDKCKTFFEHKPQTSSATGISLNASTVTCSNMIYFNTIREVEEIQDPPSVIVHLCTKCMKAANEWLNSPD